MKAAMVFIADKKQKEKQIRWLRIPTSDREEIDACGRSEVADVLKWKSSSSKVGRSNKDCQRGRPPKTSSKYMVVLSSI